MDKNPDHQPEISSDAFDADFFHVLGDPTRLQIFVVLLKAEKPMNVTDITASTGLERPNVSMHLATLKRSGIVTCKREGKFRLYEASIAVVRNKLECALKALNAVSR